MAINFPNSPSDGDVFGNFTYDTSIPGWRKTPENSASLPAGTIVQWPGATAPANWLLADGSAVSRTTYASLFAAIGVQYGSGDGTSTFNLPNLKGKVAVGLDGSQSEFNVLGETGGAKTHTLTESEMPSHTHIQNSHNHTQDSHNHTQNAHNHNFSYSGGQYSGWPLSTGGGGNVTLYVGNDAGYNYVGIASNTATNQATTATNQATTATNQSTGGGGAHNNLQPYIVLNYIIKTSAGVTSGDSELATRVGVVESQNNSTPLSPNAIINGGMDVAQRGTSFSLASGGGARYYAADRFSVMDYTWSSGSNLTVSQDSTVIPPSGSGIYNSFKVATGGTGLTYNSGGWTAIRTSIEGQDIARYYGTTMTLSFWVRSSTVGTYSILMSNGDSGTGSPAANRAYAAEYTIISSDTWERKTLTVDLAAATAAGTWNKTNSLGLEISWMLGAHSDRTGDAYKSGWTTYSALHFKTSTGTNWATGANKTFYLTGVQLEQGSYATSFRRNAPSIQSELAACQRYYYQTAGGVGDEIGVGTWWSTTSFYFQVTFPVTMRARPSLTTNNAAGFMTYSQQGTRTASTFGVNNTSPNIAMCYVTTAVAGTSGYAGWCETNVTGAVIRVDAEL